MNHGNQHNSMRRDLLAMLATALDYLRAGDWPEARHYLNRFTLLHASPRQHSPPLALRAVGHALLDC